MAKKKPAAKSEAEKQSGPMDFDSMIAELEKKFGDSVQWGGAATIKPTQATSTGLASLDIALGCHGIPDGRIIEIYGTESSGKTTLALQIVSSFQQQNKLTAYIDAEHALDYNWATNIGVDVKKWLLSQPDSGEQALDIVQSLATSGIVKLVVVDSVAALVPQEELDGDISDRQIGAQARLMSKGMRKLAGICLRSGTTVIFINQLRDKIGQIGPSYMHPEITPGGRALKFYSSMRLEVRRAETLRTSNIPYGMVTKVKVAKNKVAPPFRSAALEIHYGAASGIYGFNKVQALVNGAVETSVVKLRGSNYYFNDQKIAVGKEKLAEVLNADPELFNTIYAEVYHTAQDGIVGSEDSDSPKDTGEDESSFDEEG
jgi:recombination protein RecA